MPAEPNAVVVRLRLIGQMEAWTLAQESVLPPGRKTRALLAVVALSAPRPVLRSRLAEMLWSRRPEEQARASLRQEIHRLLDSLSPAKSEVMVVNRDHLALKPGAVWIDVEEVLRATPQQPASLALLDGELLEELDGVDPAFDSWLAVERERLRDRARTVAEMLLREQLEPEAAITAAQQLLAIDRAHEGAWRALMRAHAARGERGMAIQTYERCRAVLADLLDAAPSPETQRLLGEIRTGKAAPQLPFAPSEGARMEAPPAVPSRGGAKVGVLPLQLVGTDEAESHLAFGLAEEITSALARFRWMFLVSSTSLARMAQQTRDETAIRRTFGLDFLLDGTIQRAARRVRITLRLLDLRAGNQVVWARRFDRQAHDLLTLQDEVAAEVVAQIDPEILQIESRRAAHRTAQDANAYDLVLRALPLIDRLNREEFAEAGELLERAIGVEPDYAAAHAWSAYWQIFNVGQGWAQHPSEALVQAGRHAERAITLDPQDARALTIAGHVRSFLHHRLREGMALHDRALSQNPNLAMAWAFSAITLAYAGQLDEAERRYLRYKRLSPMDPHAFFFDGASLIIDLLRHNYESAVATARQISELNPMLSATCKHYLAALGHIGFEQEAALVRRRLLSIEPDFSVRRYLQRSPFERPEDREHYAAGLRLAGIPEGD
ncbi:MAG TPA: BTAD domain-containing putative transcriptional regulator [Acetobacteraceae bacterium]|nr:BTAD domain-containing putative transcriptional regulator [Acetobacteraceae bacterium]